MAGTVFGVAVGWSCWGCGGCSKVACGSVVGEAEEVVGFDEDLESVRAVVVQGRGRAAESQKDVISDQADSLCS